MEEQFKFFLGLSNFVKKFYRINFFKDLLKVEKNTTGLHKKLQASNISIQDIYLELIDLNDTSSSQKSISSITANEIVGKIFKQKNELSKWI